MENVLILSYWGIICRVPSWENGFKITFHITIQRVFTPGGAVGSVIRWKNKSYLLEREKMDRPYKLHALVERQCFFVFFLVDVFLGHEPCCLKVYDKLYTVCIVLVNIIWQTDAVLFVHSSILSSVIMEKYLNS